MFEELKNLIKHSSIYGGGAILNKLIAFFLIPLYTHYLTTAQYGTLELIELTGYIIGMFLSFGISASIMRFYNEYKDTKEKNEIISSSLLTITAISLIGFGSMIFLADKLSLIIFKNIHYTNFFKIMLLTLLFSLIGEIPLTYLRIKEKSILYTIISLARTGLSLSLNILFVAFLKFGILGILISGCITNGLNCVVLFLLTLKDVKFGFSISKVGEMLKYGLPFIAGGIGMFILNFGDRFFLQRYSNLSEVGIYSLGYKFGMILHFLIFEPFMLIWGPKRFELAKQEQGKEIISKVFTYFCYIQLFAGLGLSLLIRDILRVIVGSEFQSAYKIVPIIVLSYLLLGAYFHVQIGILLEKKTKYIAIIVLISAISNIMFCRILIPMYHGMGAAIATLSSFLIMFVLAYFISNKLYVIPFEFLRIIKILLVASVIFLIGNQLQIESLFLSIGVNLILFLSFPIFLYYFNFYNSDEVGIFKKLKTIVIRKASLIIK